MFGIFIDIEANGLDVNIHYPIDLAFKIIYLESLQIIDEYSSVVFLTEDAWKDSNSASLNVNGYNYNTISQGATIRQIKTDVIGIFEKNHITRDNSVFVGQNPSFDRVFFSKIIPTMLQESLLWPYRWLDLSSMFYAFKYMKHSQRVKISDLSKDHIAQHFGIEEEEKPHTAERGVNHLLQCYRALIRQMNLN
jgi:oligoribonuclease